MVYKFRVILDAPEDVFRDIAIDSSSTLEDFHNAIVGAFGFDGTEGGSFYTCDQEWQQNQEIPLFDIGDVPGELRTMADFVLSDLLDEESTKILYIYDPFNMWTFFVELAAIEQEDETQESSLPALLFAHGVLPSQSATSNLEAPLDYEDMFGDYEEDYNEEDFEDFQSEDSYDDYNY